MTEKRHYLYVPFAEKSEAKALGARFDVALKQWYFDPNKHTRQTFGKWQDHKKLVPLHERMYVYVPYGMGSEAKSSGCRFDWDRKRWYVDTTTNIQVPFPPLDEKKRKPEEVKC